MDTISISYFLLSTLRGYDLHIGVSFVAIRNTNQIYYYHTVVFFISFNAYSFVNVLFIHVTDTEQKQIQPCCNSTNEIGSIEQLTVAHLGASGTASPLSANLFYFPAVFCKKYAK